MKKRPVPSKKEIIEVMKKCKSRTQFCLIYNFHYRYVFKNHKKLLDKYLPKQEVASHSMGELTTKHFLQKLFGETFLSCRPDWLINPKTKSTLELDGYCKKLKIAFEYGDHSRIKSYQTDEYRKFVKYKDSIKRRVCKKRGVKLIQVKEDVLLCRNSEERLRVILLSEFKRLKIKVPINFNKVKYKVIAPKNSKYTREYIINLSKKYDMISQFIRKNGGVWSAAYKLGVDIEVKEYFRKKNNTGPWTKEEILECAKKCKTTSDFITKNRMAYMAAIRMDILDEAMTGLIKWHAKKGHWNKDENVLCALKECNSFKEFQDKYPAANLAIIRNKRMDLVRKVFKQ